MGQPDPNRSLLLVNPLSSINKGRPIKSPKFKCPVSKADISISIHHSALAFSINNQHIMEAATAADFWLRLLAIASLGSDKNSQSYEGGIAMLLL